jgi:alginate O-acetyltransferase complex protein AlgI
MLNVALIDLGVGSVLYWVLPRLLPAATPVWVRLAIGTTAHFLVFAMGSTALIAALYRWCGVGVERPWQSPLAATSLADFWGVRWNRIFSGFARDMLFYPLARLVGVRKASFGVFLFSGLLHEWAFSVTALGGYGGPTAYFLIQWLGLQIESSRAGKQVLRRNPLAGRLWTLLVLGVPLPLLLHEPFLTRVAAPALSQLGVPGF